MGIYLRKLHFDASALYSTLRTDICAHQFIIRTRVLIELIDTWHLKEYATLYTQ